MIKLRRKSFTQTKKIALIIDSETESDLCCPFCGETARMVSPLLAAKLFNLGTREIYRMIEAGDLHFVEFQDKQIFICPPSLARRNSKSEDFETFEIIQEVSSL